LDAVLGAALLDSNHFPSLFRGVDAAVNLALGVKSYDHRATVIGMRAKPPGAAVGSDIAHRVYDEIETAFRRLVENPHRSPSRQNWRLHHPCLRCSDARGEVGLERALVGACKRVDRRDWWNQVPIASGLVNGSADKRRAIDLVKHRGGRSYEFVELKIASNTALYATVEILQYGFVWLLSRQFRVRLGYSEESLLDADDVRLNVLAWKSYFQGVDFNAFEAGVATAVHEIGALQGVSMAFRMVQLPESFAWPGEHADEALCAVLDGLFPRETRELRTGH
jgi:hypothetical protein